jgi:Tol biopolymer transport system component
MATSIPEPPASTASLSPTSLPKPTIQLSLTPIAISEKVLLRAIPSGDSTFKIIDFATNEIVKLVDVTSFLNQRSLDTLAWSPDGKRLLFHARNTALYIYSLETDDVQVLEQRGHIQGTGFNGFFDWSPDNQWIAAATETSGVSKIYLMHPDGTNLHSISSSPFYGMAQALSWTPDGQYLLFSLLKYAGSKRSSYDIWMIDVNGKHPKELVKNITGWKTDIAVSPDGMTIYYQSDAGMYMASIRCYYENACGEIPSKEVNELPVTWYREFMPRWTGTYPTY